MLTGFLDNTRVMLHLCDRNVSVSVLPYNDKQNSFLHTGAHQYTVSTIMFKVTLCERSNASAIVLASGQDIKYMFIRTNVYTEFNMIMEKGKHCPKQEKKNEKLKMKQ